MTWSQGSAPDHQKQSHLSFLGGAPRLFDCHFFNPRCTLWSITIHVLRFVAFVVYVTVCSRVTLSWLIWAPFQSNKRLVANHLFTAGCTCDHFNQEETTVGSGSLSEYYWVTWQRGGRHKLAQHWSASEFHLMDWEHRADASFQLSLWWFKRLLCSMNRKKEERKREKQRKYSHKTQDRCFLKRMEVENPASSFYTMRN